MIFIKMKTLDRYQFYAAMFVKYYLTIKIFAQKKNLHSKTALF